MKKVLILGAAKFQIPLIEYACNSGMHVITADNNSSNPGHALAHKNYEICTVDYESILEVAVKEQIDGIVSFASDVSMYSVAKVAEELNLTGNSLAAVEILTNKYLFRKFLTEKGLQNNKFQVFSKKEAKNIKSFVNGSDEKLIIKPVDANGSKGVSITSNGDEDLKKKVKLAFEFSNTGQIIIEDFQEKKGKQICGDGFLENGKIVSLHLGDGHFYDDEKHMAPWGETFPCTQPVKIQKEVKKKLQNIIHEVNLQNGPFNIDVLVNTNNELFFIEIGPRNGGNAIPQLIKLNSGVDMIEGCLFCALEKSFRLKTAEKPVNSLYSSYMLHSKNQEGIFKKIEVSNEGKSHIFSQTIFVEKGTKIKPFFQGGNAVGNLILKFSSHKKCLDFYENIHDHFKVVLEI